MYSYPLSLWARVSQWVLLRAWTMPKIVKYIHDVLEERKEVRGQIPLKT